MSKKKENRFMEWKAFVSTAITSLTLCSPSSFTASENTSVPSANPVPYSQGSHVDVYGSGSFLYWCVGEEGLVYGTNGVANGGFVFQSVENTDLSQSFSYKPGFQAQIGVMVNQKWALDAEYTFIKGTNSLNQSAPSSPILTSGNGVTFSGTPVWVMQSWFIQSTSNGQALSGSAVHSDWHYNIQLLDLTVRAPRRSDRILNLSAFGGLRGALIKQKLDIALTEISGQGGITLPSQPIHSHNQSSCWAVGPRFGLDASCNLPRGIRLTGDCAGSLLYTRYTKLIHKEDAASTTFNSGPYTFKYRAYSCVRPVTELQLGVAWGRASACKKYAFDLAVSYDFQLFWSQNMMAKILSEFLIGTAGYAGDLYCHGLTVSARLDF